MLQKLYIRNYAIIDELTVSFDDRLNVITGETGAGKSIILGAFSLILGERADTAVLINRDEKSVVEAHFLTEHNPGLHALLRQQDLDVEPVTIIRREISAAGKSRAFINDTPVTLVQLNEVTSMLVDLHRQFDNRAIEDNNFLFQVIDAVAENQAAIQDYQSKFRIYRQLLQDFRSWKEEQENWKRESDYKQFLFDELEQAAFKENEIEDAELALKQLEHSDQIRSALQATQFLLEEGEQPINNEIRKLSQQLQALLTVYPDASGISERLESAFWELKDIATETGNLLHHIDADPEQMAFLQERLNQGYRLLKKHSAQTTTELIAIHQQLAHELLDKSNAEEKLLLMQEQIDTTKVELTAIAAGLSARRQETAITFSQNVNDSLKLVGMPNAALKIAIEEAPELHFFGSDKIDFLLDANKSGKYTAVQKAASGGELSRIMLCIKTLTAQALALPTLIFDEVDAGISGEAARQVGILLHKLSAFHQVLCITHQPQVAGKGNRHFYVYKSAQDNQQIKTRVRTLDEKERIFAIAQMIGGEHPSEVALENARELIQMD